jgi:hypothetical protein
MRGGAPESPDGVAGIGPRVERFLEAAADSLA